MATHHVSRGPYERFVKRPLDAVLASIALVGLSPVMLAIAALVRVKHGSPVLFSQERPGLDEKVFRLYKFRSMSNARDDEGRLLPDDERLTRFGQLLRSTSLDELPELINIIKGDMAIVGPRPLLVEYLPYYTDEEHRRHEVRPGLSGLAQVNGRNASSWDEKFSWDLRYVDDITFLGDTRIVLTTLVKVLKRSDVLVGSQIAAGRLDDARREQVSAKPKEN